MTENKPAIHTPHSFDEIISINLLNAWIAETHRAMPDIRSNDRWPNIDGYIELTDSSGSPTGLLKVQVKKLNTTHLKELTYSFNNWKFLTYCKECKDIIPILFIGVDLHNQKAYWIHINDKILKTGKKTIKFNENQIIQSRNHNFIKDWNDITQKYQNLPKEFQKLEKTYSILSELTTEAFGKRKKGYIEIHTFLDEINYLLDYKVPIAKEIYYPNTWKIGLAYNKFNNENLSYALYPIAIEKNDIQIKKINQNLISNIISQNLGFKIHHSNNPILEKPKSYAYEVIHNKLKKILDLKLLNYTDNHFLAKEFIFAFIDNFHEQMGLEQKDEYTIKEIKYGFYKYLPYWLQIAYESLPDSNRFKGNSFYDPIVISFLESKKQNISQKVKKDLKQDKNPPKIIMGNDELPFDSMTRFLELFSNNEKILRPYTKKDLLRLNNTNTLIFNTFSKKDLEKNVKTFFQYFLDEYKTIIQNNFPLMKEELDFFGEANLILINTKTKGNYKHDEELTITFYYLKSIENKTEKEIIYNHNIDNNLTPNKVISINDNRYKILKTSNQNLSFIFEDTPMHSFIYCFLEEELEKHFTNLKYDQSNKSRLSKRTKKT